MHVLQKSLREEGARFLFKGWLPAFIRLGPNTVLLFVFFEVRILPVVASLLCPVLCVLLVLYLPTSYSNSRMAGENSSSSASHSCALILAEPSFPIDVSIDGHRDAQTMTAKYLSRDLA